MAVKNVASLGIVLEAASNVKKGVQQAEQEAIQGAKKIQKQIEGQVDFSKATKSQDEFGRSTEEMADKQQQAASKIASAQAPIEDTISAYANLKQTVDDLKDQALSEFIEKGEVSANTSNKLKGANEELAGATDALSTAMGEKFTPSAVESQMAINGLAFQAFLGAFALQTLAMQFQVIADQVFNLGKKSVQAFAALEEASANLQVSSGIGKESADKLTDSFADVSAIIPKTAEEFNNLSKVVVESGLQSEAAIFQATVRLAQLSTIIDSVPADQLGKDFLKLASEFNLSVGEMDNTASVLLEVSKGLNGSFMDLLGATNLVANSASDFNMSFQDTVALIETIAPRAGSAAEAGNELATVLDTMGSNAEVFADRMGISIAEFNERMADDGMQVLEDYIETLRGYESQSDKNIAATEDFGAKGAKTILGLEQDFESLVQAQKDVGDEFQNANTFQDDFDAKSQTLNASWKQLQNTFSVLFKEIGRDLLPIITKGIQMVQQVAAFMIALWRSLSPEAKKAIIAFGIFVVVLGAVLTATAFVASIIAGLIVIVGALAAVVGTVSGAILVLIGIFLALAAVAAAIVALFGGLSGTFDGGGIRDKIAKWLGIDKLGEELEKVENDAQDSFGNIADSAESELGRAGKAILDVQGLLQAWANTFLGDYVYSFTEADWALLDSVSEIAQQHFDILEEAGTMSAQQALDAMQKVRGVLGDAINEMKTLGSVTEQTYAAIENAVGGKRAESILSEIRQGILVGELEESVKSLREELTALKDALREEIDAINDQIKQVKNDFAQASAPTKAIIDALKQQKEELERAYKEQKRILDANIRGAEQQYNAEKDRYEEVKRINDAELQILKDEEDLAKDRLDDAKDALSELKKLRDKELQVAKGMADYADLNLKAAQNALKRERILGKDEFDASFRAALTRVESAEANANLAEEAVIMAERRFADEIDAAEERVSVEEEALEAIQDTIKATKRIQQAEERAYEELVDIAKQRLNDAKRALEIRRNQYEADRDVVEQQLDVQEAILRDLERQRDAQLAILEQQKEAIQDQYDAEIDVIQDKLDQAQKTLDKEKEYLNTLQRLNDEYIKNVNDRINAANADLANMQDPTIPQPNLNGNFPGIGEGMLDDLKLGIDIEMPDFGEIGRGILNGIIEFIKNIPTPMEIGEALGQKFRESVQNNPELWKNIAKLMFGLIFPPAGIYMLLTEVDWGKLWEDVKTLLNDTIKNVDWGEVLKTMLNIMFPGVSFILGFIKGALGIDSDFEWDTDVKDPLVTKVKSINWAEVALEILGAIGAGLLSMPMQVVGWGFEIAGKIGEGIGNGIGWVKEKAEGVYNGVKDTIGGAINKGREWGGKIVERLGSGISGAKYHATNAINKIVGWGGGIRDIIQDKISDARTWGRHLVENLSDGIENAKHLVGNAVRSVADKIKGFLGFTVPDEGPLSGMLEWMPHMMQNLEDGIRGNQSGVARAVADTAALMAGEFENSPVLTSQITGNLDNVSEGLSADLNAQIRDKVQGGNTYNFNAGVIAATEGEMREFSRQMEKYNKNEKSRKGQ